MAVDLVKTGKDVATSYRNLQLELMHGTLDVWLKWSEGMAKYFTTQQAAAVGAAGEKFIVPPEQLLVLWGMLRLMTKGKLGVRLAFQILETVAQGIEFGGQFEVFNVAFTQKSNTETVQAGEVSINEEYAASINVTPEQMQIISDTFKDPEAAGEFQKLLKFMSDFLLQARGTPIGQPVTTP